MLKMYLKVGLALALISVLANAADQRPLDLSHWLKLLNSREPALRQEARQQLMGASTADIERLKDLLSIRPCSAAEADALEDIVTYVVARSNIGSSSDSAKPFLGVKFDEDEFAPVSDDASAAGMPIRTLPGFIGYRYLQDGDVILGIGMGKDVKLTPTFDDFTKALGGYSAGDKVTLQIQRGGKLMAVQMPLDRRPADSLNQDNLEERAEQEKSKAEAYWAQQFRPLIEAGIQG